MTKQEIEELQKIYKIQDMQNWINSGAAWRMEGTIGRKCMSYLSVGVCYLPLKPHYDFWGNEVPSRTNVPTGTMGSLSLSKEFWSDTEKVIRFFTLEEELKKNSEEVKQLDVEDLPNLE